MRSKRRAPEHNGRALCREVPGSGFAQPAARHSGWSATGSNRGTRLPRCWISSPCFVSRSRNRLVGSERRVLWANRRPIGSSSPLLASRLPLHLIRQVTLRRDDDCTCAEDRKDASPGTPPGDMSGRPPGSVAIKKPCICRPLSGTENQDVQSRCRAVNKLIFFVRFCNVVGTEGCPSQFLPAEDCTHRQIIPPCKAGFSSRRWVPCR
jgi:hypothetical protein